MAYFPHPVDYAGELPMAFTVDTFQVGLYGGIVRNHHDDAKTAEGFAQANLQVGAQPGLIAELVGSHEQAKGEIVKALTALTSVCEASSAELDRTRQMYDRVDAGSAERLDQTYPDPGSPPQMPSVPGLPADTSTQAVRQLAFPAERLKPPQQVKPGRGVLELGSGRLGAVREGVGRPELVGFLLRRPRPGS